MYKFEILKHLSIQGNKANEDSYSYGDSFLVVIDGATGVSKDIIQDYKSDAQWLAVRTTELISIVAEDKNKKLCDILHSVTNELAKEYKEKYCKNKEPDWISSPSAAMSLLRINKDKLEYIGFADCLVILETTNNTILTIESDSKHTFLDKSKMDQAKTIAKEKGISISEAVRHESVRAFSSVNRRLRNLPHGYPVFDLTGNGIKDAKQAEFEIKTIKSVAVMSDGFSDIYRTFRGYEGKELFFKDIKEKDLEKIHLLQRQFENSDPTFDKWPRFKHSDDATAIFAKIVTSK